MITAQTKAAIIEMTLASKPPILGVTGELGLPVAVLSRGMYGRDRRLERLGEGRGGEGNMVEVEVEEDRDGLRRSACIYNVLAS